MKNRIFKVYLSIFLFYFITIPAGNAATQKKEIKEALEVISIFKKKDPGIGIFFKNSYAYIVFPSVGKGGIGIGGAYGKGIVFRGNKYTGKATLKQVSVGIQLGGQVYREIIFFQTRTSFKKFASNKLKLSAQASALAIKKGAAASSAFKRGIAIFTLAKGGLMYEATVAGQRFTYQK